MRIRGYDEETEEFIGGVEQLNGEIASLTKTANSVGGISLFSDKEKTEFKSTTELLREISKIYDELSDKQQAQLLEKLGGKRQGQILASIIGNFDAVEKSLNTMTNSAGNAMAEMNIIEESLEYKLNALKETGTGIFQNLFQTSDMKVVLDVLTGLLSVIDNLTEGFGLFGTALVAIPLIAFIKNFSKLKILGLQNVASIETVAAATSHMTVADTAAAVAVSNLSKEEKIHILRLKGLSLEEAEATLKTAEYTASTTAATGVTAGLTGATSGLKTAVQGLFTAIKSHPFIALAAAILSVITLVIKANESFEEWKQETVEKGNTVADETNKLRELVDKYKQITAQGKLDKEAREEIKGVQSQIVDLVGSQASNLDLVNGKLDDEQNKLEKIANTIIDMPTLETAYNTARDNTRNEKNIQIAPFAEGTPLFSEEGYISANLVPAGFGKKFKSILKKVMEEGGYGYALDGDNYNLRFYNLDENDFKSRIEAYEQILEELRTTEGFDTKSDLFTKLLEQKTQLAEKYKEQTKAADNYLNGFLSKEYITNNNEVNSYDAYLKFRENLLNDLKNDNKISEMMEENVFDEEGLEKSVDNYLSQLTGFKEYYDKWYDELGSDSAKKAKELDEKLSTDWFSKLSVEDKEIVAKIDVDTDTAKWKLQDWQNALKKEKDKTVDSASEMSNAFSQLLEQKGTTKEPSFVESIEKSVEKFQKLEDALVKFESGTLKDNEKVSLFKTFPQLTAYANNLGEGIKNVISSMRSDVVSKFAEQIQAFKDAGATEEEIAQLEAYERTILNIADSVDSVKNALDSMKSVFKDLDSVIKDYNENQYFSLESLEKLGQNGQRYLSYLSYENGQLKINEEAYKKLVLAQIDEIETKATLQATTDLQSLTDETAAKEYLAKVNIDLAQSQLTAAQAAFQYQLALKLAQGGSVAKAAQKVADNLNSLRNIFASARSQVDDYAAAMLGATSATEKKAKASEKAKSALESEQRALEHSKKALEDEKKALEDTKSEYEKAQKAIEDLIKWTQNYIKQIKEDEVKALQDKKEKFDDLIEKQKESLQAEKDLRDYEKSVGEKQNDLASNALKVSVSSLDDSGAGKKAYKKAQEEYKKSQTDMEDFLYDHSIETREKALDQLKEDTDKSYDEQIKTIQDYLSNEVQLYRDACSMIDNDNGDLYGKLLSYCLTYTTTGKNEFDHMWSLAQTAMEKYNVASVGTMQFMDELKGRIYDVDDAIDAVSKNIETYENRISDVKTQLDNLKDAAIEAKNAIDAANSTPLTGQKGTTSFWVNYNGKKYETGYNYNGDTEANRLLAASELTKLIAKDVSGFDNYGLGVVQGLLGVGGNETGHHWTYTFNGVVYESRAVTKASAIADIRRQLAKKYGNSDFVLNQVNSKIRGYASGTRSAKSGIAQINENGLETLMKKTPNGDFVIMNQDDKVYTKKQTDNLYDFSGNPEQFLAKLADKGLSPLSQEELANLGLWGDSSQLGMINSAFGVGGLSGLIEKITGGSGITSSSATTNNIAPVVNITIQGDATQSTVNALHAEAKNIVQQARNLARNDFIETVLKGRKWR